MLASTAKRQCTINLYQVLRSLENLCKTTIRFPNISKSPTFVYTVRSAWIEVFLYKCFSFEHETGIKGSVHLAFNSWFETRLHIVTRDKWLQSTAEVNVAKTINRKCITQPYQWSTMFLMAILLNSSFIFDATVTQTEEGNRGDVGMSRLWWSEMIESECADAVCVNESCASSIRPLHK